MTTWHHNPQDSILHAWKPQLNASSLVYKPDSETMKLVIEPYKTVLQKFFIKIVKHQVTEWAA
jgi:hypothetical protein